MKNGLVIADSGPIFSLALIDKLEILNDLFDNVRIPVAVLTEITIDKSKSDYQKLYNFFNDKTCQITELNELSFIMDPGESESLVLYKELQADFLLIDDRKARKIAETLNVKCIGLMGLLATAKDKGYLEKLKPFFEIFLNNKRYYSIELLNAVLTAKGEEKINYKS